MNLNQVIKRHFGNDVSYIEFKNGGKLNLIPKNINGNSLVKLLGKGLNELSKKEIRQIGKNHPNVLKLINDTRSQTKKTLSTAEKLGIPKVERRQLNPNLREALEDLVQYVKSGSKRLIFRVRPGKEDDIVYWGTKQDTDPTFNQFVINNNIPLRSTNITRAADNKGAYIYISDKNMAGYSGSKLFPTAFGEVNMLVDGPNSNKIILTSPRVDALDGVIEEGADFSHLPNTIDKDIIKNFWINAGRVLRPGSYLSGDNGQLPLGSKLIELWKDSRFTKPLDLKEKAFFTARTGLSPDSYSSIIRLALREGNSLRWGEGFTKWNSSAVYNKKIYDAFKSYQKGELTAEEYKKIFDDWAIPLGGREAVIKRTPERIVKGIDLNGNPYTQVIKAKEDVIIPHPYIYKLRRGGKLIKRR